MGKKLVISLLLIVLILVCIIGYLAYVIFAPPAKIGSAERKELAETYELNLNETEIENLVIDEAVVSYMLFKLEAYNLHNPPLSSNTPKIEVVVKDEHFNSEIRDGDIITTTGQIDDEDISINLYRGVAIDFIKNEGLELEVLATAINEGRMYLNVQASYTTLLLKGYLPLYKKFTGNDIEELPEG